MVRIRAKKNWESFTYIDNRGTRHSDPYKVLVLRPINKDKTAPTYEDINMFVREMLSVEQWNDNHLDRLPDLPNKVEQLLNIIYEFVR